MPIEQRADDELLRKLEAPPGHDAVGDIGGERAEQIRFDNRLLVGNVDGGHGVQVAARLAIDVGNIEIRLVGRPHAQRGFKLVVARLAQVGKQQQATGGRKGFRIDGEFIIGVAGQEADARDDVGAYFLIEPFSPSGKPLINTATKKSGGPRHRLPGNYDQRRIRRGD